ncbi:MAG: hypothetical protein ACI4KO_01230 [Ruminiclostridium sp.]
MAEDVVFKVAVDDSGVEKQLENSVESVKSVEEAAQNANKSIADSAAKAEEAVEKASEAFDNAKESASEFGTEVKKTEESTKSYGKEADSAAKNTDSFKKATQDAEKSTEDFGNSVDNLKSKVSDAGKTIATIGGTVAAAMSAIGVAAVKSAGELEQNVGGSKAVFESYADEIQEAAKKAYSSMGLAESEYLAVANKMGALFQGVGLDTAESVELTIAAMQRAADVASIMGISGTDAMEAIAGAAKGNFTMMDNLGVAINDTTLEIYAQEKGLGKLETTQQKVTAAMELFMEKSAYAAENYAKENETFAGALSTLQAHIQNIVADMGEKLLPKVTEFIQYVDDSSDEIADTIGDIGDAIASAIEFLSGMIKVLWEHKEAVAAFVVALVSFKVAMSIGNVVSAAVSSIRLYKIASDQATVSQLALNAAGMANPFVLIASVVVGAISGVVAFAASAQSCSENLKEMNATAEEMMDAAEEYMKQSEELSEVSEKYSEIENSEKSAYEKGVELKNLQDLLIEQYGSQAEGIDLVNGKYDEQLGLLGDLIDKNKELSLQSAKAAYLTAKEAQEKAFTFNVTAENADIRNIVQDMLEESANKRGIKTSTGVLWGADGFTWEAGTTYEQRDAVLTEVINSIDATYGDKVDATVYNSLITARDENKKAWETYLDVEKRYNELTDPNYQYKPKETEKTSISSNTDNKAKEAKTVKSGDTDEYKSLKNTLIYKHDMDEIGDEEYINQLTSLRDTYLETDSDEWRNVNLTIKRLQDSKNKTTNAKGSAAPKLDANYTKAKATLDYRYNMEEIGDAEYVNQLAKLRDTYLEADSEEWRNTNLAIKRVQDANKKSNSKTAVSKSNSKSESGTVISIDSYIPTAWDDADTANEKLKKGLGLALAGNSKTGKNIEGLEDMVQNTVGLDAKTNANEKVEATLSDVVSAIKALQKSDEKRKISLEVELRARDLMIGTVAVADINDITRKNGKSPLI